MFYLKKTGSKKSQVNQTPQTNSFGDYQTPNYGDYQGAGYAESSINFDSVYPVSNNNGKIRNRIKYILNITYSSSINAINSKLL